MKKPLIAFIVGLYIYTWVLGVPASHNTVAELVESAGQKLSETNEPFIPIIEFGPSFPLLPFVVISNHGYYVGPLWAVSGWWFCYGAYREYDCLMIYGRVS